VIDFRPVGYILGWLLLVLGLLMILPMLLDLVDGSINAEAFALSAVLTILAGAAVALACASRRTRNLDLRQGFLFTSSAWALLPAAATLPLMLGAPGLSVTDAYFETMSAMTTTGSTVIVGLDHLPRGALLWRGLLQWMGGIGVVLMAMILLPILNIGGMQLLRIADFNTLDKVMPRAGQIALSIGAVYLGLTLGCALGYVWGGMDEFDAIVHAMTTIATGGFANYDASFSSFSVAAQYVAIVFMLLSAMSFMRYVQLLRGDPCPLTRDSQIRFFLLVYAGFAAAVLASRLLTATPLTETTVREVLFNVASILSCTGYASADYSAWGGLAQVLFLCIMLVGGCSGSTAGGPKIFRYQLLLAAIAAEVRRLHMPSVVFTPHYQGRAVSHALLDSVSAFMMMYFLTFGTCSVLLVLLDVTPIAAISGIAQAMANAGPGLGPEVGPAGNFAGQPAPAKWVLMAAMMLGRLELMSVLVLLTAAFWRG
jgi:trk system potassium uptake protein TrkH